LTNATRWNVLPALFGISLLFLVSPFARALESAPTTQPSSANNQLAVPLEEEGFDAAQYLTGDWAGYRAKLFAHGLSIEPYLILDYSHNFSGGVDPGGNSFRQRFNLPITIDTEKLFNLHGGTIFAVYQVQNGGNASHTLTGDAQNFSFGTDADNRSQLGQLWYEQ
jgi:carbohydrate-selective porin OprB